VALAQAVLRRRTDLQLQAGSAYRSSHNVWG
jgi:hypothetical protein